MCLTYTDDTHVVASHRLWLTADRDRLVPEGHPDAAFLFAGIGKRVTHEDAVKYGLIEGDRPKLSAAELTAVAQGIGLDVVFAEPDPDMDPDANEGVDPALLEPEFDPAADLEAPPEPEPAPKPRRGRPPKTKA